MLKLYYSQAACSLVPHIALEEAGLPFELLELHIQQGAPLPPEFLAQNPLGRVPTLIVEDGRALTEVPAILTFIAEQVPERALLPQEPWLRAKAQEWMSLFVSSVHPSFIGFFQPARYTDDLEARVTLAKDSRGRFLALLGHVERRLPDAPYVLGEAYSLCDAYALLFYLWGRHFEFPVQTLSRYSALAARVLARPATQRALAREGLDKPRPRTPVAA